MGIGEYQLGKKIFQGFVNFSIRVSDPRDELGEAGVEKVGRKAREACFNFLNSFDLTRKHFKL